MKIRPVESVQGIQKKSFKNEYFLKQKPVLIKGLAKKYPAGEKWTTDYIRQVCGDVDVDIFDNNNKNDSSAFTSPDLKMKFSRYFDSILKGEASTYRMFLFNMFKERPELRKDFPCPDFFRGILGRIGFMFFGARDIKVRIHQDIDMSNVLLTQFHGRKKVLLVSPEYSDLLYRLPFNTYSLVDLDQPDYNKYPGLRHIEVFECLLEPGDALYMPSGYWHYITYVDGGFSVSYRKMAHSLKFKINGVMSFLVYMPFDKMMNKFFGKYWLDKKLEMAEARANKAIKKLHPPEHSDHEPIFSGA